jgi:hypothetical protein
MNTRHLANGMASEYIGRFDCAPGSQWKRHVKRATRRSVRHNERRSIANALND